MDDTININTHFYLKWRSVISLFFVLLFSTVLYYAITQQMVIHIIMSIFNLVASVGGIWFLSTMEVNENGLVLYKVNRLKWHEITSAKRTSFLGLPYILLKRKKGFTWWLPLYFVGDANLQATLLNVVPNGNPLKNSLID